MSSSLVRCHGVLAWLGLMVLVACKSQREQPQQRNSSQPSASAQPAAKPVDTDLGSQPATRPSEPVFSWKLPTTAKVRDTSVKDGTSADVEYWLDFCPESSDAFSVTYREYKFVTLNGKPASSPELAQSISALQTLATAVPKVIVGTDGHFRDVEGLDEMLERMRRTFADKDFANVQKLLQQPTARQTFIMSLSKYWQAWMGYWLAFNPEDGLRQVIKEPTAIDGVFLDTEITFEPMGGGYAKLSRRTTANAEVAPVILKGLLDSLGAAQLNEAPEVTFELLAETETAWPVVRPRSVHTRLEAHVAADGKKDSRIEDHKYLFDWEAAGDQGVQCNPK